MSKYSGKCDLYDELFMIRDDEAFRRKCVIRLSGDPTPIKNECDKDLVPYFPTICIFGSGSKDGWSGTYTNQSWVDVEDARILQSVLDDIKKEYRKCKRKKQQFNAAKVVEQIMGYYLFADKEVVLELAMLVCVDGNKAKLPSVPGMIRTKLRDHYRDELYDTMIEYGYTKDQAEAWCYRGKKTW